MTGKINFGSKELNSFSLPSHPISVDNILIGHLLSFGKTIVPSEFVDRQIYITELMTEDTRRS